MTLVEHLTELRRRLIVSIIAVFVGGLVAFVLYRPIFSFLVAPYRHTVGKQNGISPKLLATDPLEGFAIRLKLSTYCGVFFASPVVLWEFWRFVTPGLHPKEKRYAIPFIAASVLLFSFGAIVAYLVFPPGLEFLKSVGGSNLANFYTPTNYFRLLTLMVIAFGAAFEFPVVLVCLEIANVLPTARLRKWRRGAIVAIVAFAAIITPSQDPYSLFGMAIPMYLFYEAAIAIGRALGK